MKTAGAAILALAAAELLLTGCQQPLSRRKPEPVRAAVERAISRELAGLPPRDVAPGDPAIPASPTDIAPDVPPELAARRQELEAIGPLASGEQAKPNLSLGADLAGREGDRVELSLATAIDSALVRNFGIQISQLLPQITAEEVIAAESIFDAVLFANIDMGWNDTPQRIPVIMGLPLGNPANQQRSARYETGVRKRFSPGTEVIVSTDLTRLYTRPSGLVFSPNPAYNSAVRIGASQPLLRGFGREVNTASIRLAENQQERSTHQLLADEQALAARTASAYWDLHAAWQQLAIAQWLVEVGVKVRDVMENRREIDTRPAQYSDAVARVEQRQADVIRARRSVRVASDALKSLINDPDAAGVSSEAVLHPTERPVEGPLAFNHREAVLSAVAQRPELQQAALEIDDAIIRQRVADNNRLPLLNLSAQAAFLGLDNEIGGAYRETQEGSFIDYLLGLAFEWPLGNRGPEAESRAARLRRSAAALNYQRTLQNVVLDVKTALRDVATNHELIGATRSFRIAQAENLRTLLIEEDLLAGLTPEFLNLKFTRQETLAQARREEVQALTNFNKSLAELRRAMGMMETTKRQNIELSE